LNLQVTKNALRALAFPKRAGRITPLYHLRLYGVCRTSFYAVTPRSHVPPYPSFLQGSKGQLQSEREFFVVQAVFQPKDGVLCLNNFFEKYPLFHCL